MYLSVFVTGLSEDIDEAGLERVERTIAQSASVIPHPTSPARIS
jgi:hypothetical protein